MAHLTRGPVLMRVALILVTLVLFVLVSGFLARVGWATGLWPWPAKPLSFVFIAGVSALELLVCAIQAYVFALLTSLYINDAENLH